MPPSPCDEKPTKGTSAGAAVFALFDTSTLSMHDVDPGNRLEVPLGHTWHAFAPKSAE